MTVVAAFLVPGSPLPYLKPDNPPWSRLIAGYKTAARALAVARPDVLLVYSTQWFAVLDQLWQTRPLSEGLHVDENWYEYGDLPYQIKADTELAQACVENSASVGIKSKGVDYDHFPIDTGTIVANNLLNPGSRWPLVIGSNNLYHGWDETERLGRMAVETASRMGRKVAIIGVGGLSGGLYRDEIDIRNDRVSSPEHDQWNRRMLRMLEEGDARGAREISEDFSREAGADMGFKHFAWILGGLGGRFYGGRIHGYGPCYGTGAAVVEFKV